MTDQLDEIINSKRMYKGTTLFTEQADKMCREIAREFAAAEVNRLLDKLDATTAEGLEFSWSIDCAKQEFEWRHVEHGPTRDGIVHASGTTKASLLEYVGFAGGSES